ncbi:major facilitator superfamily MFS_1 [Hypoxylon rubiginosum]|uniref:Major facilitator superfamily MFS_1 n=1 Tax=Hypoxylon rubiginosum TaxID=110542 RepID=A0ACB9YHY9_9PEZI|nr:major facilitator superfamily MFS_1 [Hypoxylon rubiginosum]
MASMAHTDVEPPEVYAPKESSLSSSGNQDGETRASNEEPEQKFQHTWRIILISITLSILTFISGIDASIITTSLPTITREIGGASDYVWIAQSYLFACTIPQPFYGQIADIFGRRNPLLVSVALFALGSGIAGGANNVATLIAGRLVQGLGTGGINVIPEIIICDLIPPRHRGPYLSAILSTAAIASSIGPIVGGALALADWRWIFWLNLPVSGVCAIGTVLLVNVKYQRNKTWLAALRRVDFIGSAIFIPSMVSLFFGLIMGGTSDYPWNSGRIIAPIVLGVAGWVLFHAQQSSRFCVEPSVPPSLFQNRTSATSFILIFLASITVQAICYFLPIYFQAVKNVSPLTSGIYFLPFTLALLPSGGIAAAILSKTGRYKPLHWAGFALMAIGIGLFSTLDEASSSGEWIGFQIIAAWGAGFIFTVSLPSTLAALPEKVVATATSTFAFVRAFGLVWGVTMSSIVFNGQVQQNLYTVEDTNLQQLLADGRAYTFASGSEDNPFSIVTLPDKDRGQVVNVYKEALSVVWLVFVAITGLGFLFTFALKHIELRKDRQSEFGLADSPQPPSNTEEGLQELKSSGIKSEESSSH